MMNVEDALRHADTLDGAAFSDDHRALQVLAAEVRRLQAENERQWTHGADLASQIGTLIDQKKRLMRARDEAIEAGCGSARKAAEAEHELGVLRAELAELREQEPVAWVADADVRCFGKGPGESAFLFTPKGKWNVPLYARPVPPAPMNYCPRCGKRLGDPDGVHTCSPKTGEKE